MSIGLSLIIAIIAGLIFILVPPDYPIVARACDLAKWVCLISFSAFMVFGK